MRDVSKLKFIGSSFCSQYQSQAKFYIDEMHASGMRHLVVVYENDEHDFIAGIPDEWADRKRAGLHLLADEKSELALSRMGGAGARLWQSNALCLVEGPASASASSLCADSEIARGFAGADRARRLNLYQRSP